MRYLKVLFLFTSFLLSTDYINSQCIKLTSPEGTDNQSVCIGSKIVDIIYTFSPVVTSYEITGLPPSVTQSYNAGTYTLTLSGTPTTTGSFTYTLTVTTSGVCTGPDHVDGKITVNEIPIITGTTPNSRCGPGTVVLGATASEGIINWYDVSSGGASIGSGTTFTTPIISVTTTYYVDATSNGCTTESRTSVVATVINTPAPTGPTTQSFCTIDNPTVADLDATGTNIKWYLTAAGGTALVSTTPLVTRTYYASQTVDGCESISRLAVAVTVNNPSPPTGVSPQNFCAINNPTVANLVASGTGIKWYLTATGGTALVSTTPLVTRTYYASQTVGGCESASRLAVAVTVGNPLAPTGSSPQNFCAINNPTVANLVASGTGIKWYLTATGGTALAPTTVLVTDVYYGSQTVGGCESTSRLPVVAIVNNPPPPTGNTNQSFCSIDNPTVANLTAIGTGILWYLTPTGGTPLLITTPLVNGTYYASQTVGGCVSTLRLAVTVTVNNPPAPTGNPAQIFCSGANPTVANLVATGTNIRWYLTATGGTALVTTTPLANGTYYASQTVGGCESATRFAVTVTINQTPISNAGAGGNECDLDFVLNATPVTIGTGLWTQTSGPGVSVFTPNANTPNATVTVSVYGTYTFTWTVVNNNCFSSSVITVNFNQQPVANAGINGDECDLNVELHAIPSVGVGTWVMTSGTGSVVFSPSANNPDALVIVTTYGTKVFKWTEINGTCIDSSSVTINFYQQPVANAGTGGNNCGPEYNLSAVPSVGIGTWTVDSGPGSATFSPNANAATAQVTINAYGTYVFRWTEVNGTCSSSATVTVTFIEQPAADAGLGGDECDLNFTLNAVPGSIPGIWTKVSGPGNVVFTPNANQYNAVVTVNQYGYYDFAWTEENTLCSSTDIIRVGFHDLPPVNAGDDILLCKGSSTQLNATGQGSFSWSPASPLNNPNIYNPVATPEITTEFTVTLTDQWGCKNSDKINIEVRVQPVAYAGPDQELEYLFETNLEATAPGSDQIGEWTILSGTGDIVDINNPSSHVSDLSLELNSFVWTLTNVACPASSDTVDIIVHNLMVPTLITPNLDGNNDYFIIKGIETLGRTSLTVFNRWGARVYANNDYDNSWDGVDDNKNPLPEDTYFFILKPEKSRVLKSYVVIRR